MGDFSDLAEKILRKEQYAKSIAKTENTTIASTGYEMVKKHSRKVMQ